MLAASGCGGGSSTPVSPTPSPTPTPTPAPITHTLTGTVSSTSESRISGATVTALDGANSGRSVATNTNGEYRFDNMQAASTNFAARANGYLEDRRGTLVEGAATLNFTLPTNLSFTGTWSGQTRSTSCVDEGVLSGFCGGAASVGDSLVLVLNQSGSGVTGSINWGGTIVPASGTAQADRLTITGRGPFTPGANGIQIGFEDWDTTLSGPTLAGTFTLRLFPTASGVSGGAKLTMSLVGVSRSSSSPTP